MSGKHQYSGVDHKVMCPLHKHRTRNVVLLSACISGHKASYLVVYFAVAFCRSASCMTPSMTQRRPKKADPNRSIQLIGSVCMPLR